MPLFFLCKIPFAGISVQIRYASEHTSFEEFNSTIVTKIKHDIAERFGIPSETVDLSKFVHMRTTLSIPKHREIVEQEVGNFLYSQYPKISIDSVKTIYRSMIELLTSRQRYELLDKNKPIAVVREKKGVSKNDFSRIIETARTQNRRMPLLLDLLR